MFFQFLILSFPVFLQSLPLYSYIHWNSNKNSNIWFTKAESIEILINIKPNSVLSMFSATLSNNANSFNWLLMYELVH